MVGHFRLFVCLPCLLMRSQVRRSKQPCSLQPIIICWGLYSSYFIGCCYGLIRCILIGCCIVYIAWLCLLIFSIGCLDKHKVWNVLSTLNNVTINSKFKTNPLLTLDLIDDNHFTFVRVDIMRGHPEDIMAT